MHYFVYCYGFAVNDALCYTFAKQEKCVVDAIDANCSFSLSSAGHGMH